MDEEAKDKEEPTTMYVRLAHVFPEGRAEAAFANNLVVQHDESSFYVSFFQALPPVLMGSKEQARQQAEKLESIEARCVARVVVPAASMRLFVHVLNENLKNYNLKHGQLEQE